MYNSSGNLEFDGQTVQILLSPTLFVGVCAGGGDVSVSEDQRAGGSNVPPDRV